MARRQIKQDINKTQDQRQMAQAQAIIVDDRSSFMLRWIGPILVGATFVAMLAWTWGKWCDVLIDFGRELYTPWRLVEGDVLYRDIAAFYGPLSSYINSAWFAMFGVSLQTLSICNAVIMALFVWLLYRILLRAGSAWSAVGGCVVFLTVFGLARLLRMGNYNFINPYSHELVHGTILSFVVLALMARYVLSSSSWTLAAAGFVYGIVFLTKLEPFLAITLACDAAWFAIAWREGLGKVLRMTGVFLGSSIVPPLIAWGLLATGMPASDALRGVLGSWVYVTDPELRNIPFFRVVMGLNAIDLNLMGMMMWVGWFTLVLGPAIVAGIMIRWHVGRPLLVGAAVACAVGMAVSIVTWNGFDWDSIGRPFPLFMMIGSAVGLVIAARRTQDHESAARNTLRLMLLVFAGGMLIKMALNVRFSHYGFALAMPAAVVMIAMLLDWIPQWLTARGGAGWLLRAAAIGATASIIIFMLRVTTDSHSQLVDAIGKNGDRIPTDEFRGGVISALLDEDTGSGEQPRALRRYAQPGDTMVVIPEGIMLNYLTRMPSTVPYLTFLPPDLVMFSEERMLRDLQTDPPTFILVTHRNTREFGPRFFGVDYGLAIAAWIDANYQQIGVSGHQPSTEDAFFGVAALRRVDAPQQPAENQRGN